MITGMIRKMIKPTDKPAKQYMSANDFTAEILNGSLVIRFTKDVWVGEGDTITLEIKVLPITLEDGVLYGEVKR